MGNKDSKTLRGIERKIATGDGRKSTPLKKAAKEADKVVREANFSKKKKKRK